MRIVFSLLLSVLILLTISGEGYGQSAGKVSGRVADSTSAAVDSAMVTLKSAATQNDVQLRTDSAGNYQFENLPFGQYSITVQKTGFSAISRTFIVDASSSNIQFNFELLPGTIADVISVTAVRGEREIQDIPVRAETITSDALLKENITSTQDGLTKVPNITAVGNGPFQMRPRLRGLDSSRILIMVDGERLNSTRVATDRAGIEIGLVDPSLIQSLEVVSGSGSVLYGTDALSGTINILTDQPRTTPTLRVGGALNLFYSSNETGRRGYGRFDVSGKRFAFRFGGGLERFDNYHAGSPFNESSNYLFTTGVLKSTVYSRVLTDPFNAPFARTSSEIPNSQSQGNTMNATARFFSSDKGGMRINWLRRRNQNIGFPDFVEPFFSQKISLPFSNLDKYGFRYERYGITPWFSRIALNFYHQQQDRNLQNDFPVYFNSPPRPNDPPLDSIFRVKLLTETRQNVKSYGWDLQANFQLGSRNILTAGSSWFLDHSRDFRKNRSETSIIGFATRLPAPAQFIPANIALGPPSITYPQRVPKSDFRNLSFFIQDEFKVNKWLRIIGGGRFDRFSIETNPTAGYNPAPPEITGAKPPINLATLPSANGDQITRQTGTGDIGFVLSPNETINIIGRVGRSFRHPNLEELFFTGPATLGFIVANTTVKPETGINTDLGVRIRKSRYTASFNYFNNFYRNFISTEPVSMGSGTLLYQAINFSKLRIQGFEFDNEYSVNLDGSLLTPFISVGYLHGQIIEAVNPFAGTTLKDAPADNITPLKVIAGARWSSRSSRYWTEYNVRAQAHIDRVSPLLTESPFKIAQDLFGLNGFGVHTVRAGYNLQRESARYTLTLGLENLTNEFYREQFQFAPSRGRSLTMGLSVKFF
ncbi:MAG: TonB-dependent receptor [Acidobacteria bacterium]|nr:TonB-dependent receptor [Acidobacteriota bacterium]